MSDMFYRIKRLYWYIKVIPKLGITNVIYVQFYRYFKRSDFFKRRFPIESFENKSKLFYSISTATDYSAVWTEKLKNQAEKLIHGEIPYYAYHWIKQTNPPNWFINPFNGQESSDSELHWLDISDFNNVFGDIKNIWEISRFSWLAILARAYAVSADQRYLNTINKWLANWLMRNPLNQGPNWKCGQEAAFRVFNLLNAALIMKQDTIPSQAFVDVVEFHLKRIAPNIRYALAQRNNHATSEAAALFIAGGWLCQVNPRRKVFYQKYVRLGKKHLERSVAKLVYEDGAFAQHSVNYHRLFLDTLSFVSFWQKRIKAEPLGALFNQVFTRSRDWLLDITDSSGQCPNIGSNDGTLLLLNHSCDYQDFRPSIQLASALINQKRIFKKGPWDEALFWYNLNNISPKYEDNNRQSKIKPSGYVIMNNSTSWALLHYPNYQFRPSHNDVFHFDLWANGENLLFDSGSFSYNPDVNGNVVDFKSVHSHNTVSFDRTEQMPRLSRFLLGNWLKTNSIGGIIEQPDKPCYWQGSYKDSNGNIHQRRIEWQGNGWAIIDRFSGKSKQVEAGFNFKYCTYNLNQKLNRLTLPWGVIDVSHNAKTSVVNHKVSAHYMQKTDANRLVITLNNNSELITSIYINP